jgi:hypothetical protein
MRAILSLPRVAAHRRLQLRAFTSSYSRRIADDKSPFGGPAPPRLPKEEQEIFEKLQKQSTGAFSTPQVNQSPDSQAEKQQQEEELYPHLRGAAQPEFEGDKNPKTGEIGGPKNEPLRWGGQGDWSYNGRVTDF